MFDWQVKLAEVGTLLAAATAERDAAMQAQEAYRQKLQSQCELMDTYGVRAPEGPYGGREAGGQGGRGLMEGGAMRARVMDGDAHGAGAAIMLWWMPHAARVLRGRLRSRKQRRNAIVPEGSETVLYIS